MAPEDMAPEDMAPGGMAPEDMAPEGMAPEGMAPEDMATRVLLQTTLLYVILGACLFVAAGDTRWPQAWIFLTEAEVCSLAVGFWLARHDPALLKHRLSVPFHGNQQPWDRLFLAVALAGFASWMVLMALDARRFRWSHSTPWTEAPGAVLIALCMALVSLVFRYNSFAAPQVRLLPESGQHVVTAGPYRIVRHPMYATALLYFLGVPLLLGSWWGLLPVPFFMAAFGVRAIGEERMLRQALPGYDEYARRVRSRLFPGVW
jgi:protein-S-isoprenylcysteine O-methyltransferase Ste14